jgi:WD40 repeat protein/serine/threonine protein kinase
MNPEDKPPEPDDDLVDLLAAYDDALAQGGPSVTETLAAGDLPPERRQDIAFLQLLRTALQPAPPAAVEAVRAFLPPSSAGGLGRLGHYELIEVIGRGAMGVVLKARDESLQRVVAIKLMAPEMAAEPTARKRFTREAQAAAAVRNEHVIDIHAVEETNGIPYLVMEYIQGESLQNRLRRQGSLALEQILRIGAQIAAGLAAAHAQGLIHRDVKPANILLENGVARVKITDFGLARPVDDPRMTPNGTIAGTPQYMSPEQASGGALDHRTDLFSLGSVLYFMCTGRPPFQGDNTLAVLKRIAEDTPEPIRQINPVVPETLAAIIARLHAKCPGERFASAAEVAKLLNQLLAHMHEPALAPLPAVPPGVRSQESGVTLKESGVRGLETAVGTEVVRSSQTPDSCTQTPSARFRPRPWVLAAGVVLLLIAGFIVTESTGLTRLFEGSVAPPAPETKGRLQVRLRVTLKGHEGIIDFLAYSRDGNKLASGGHDQTIKVWDPNADKEIVTLTGHGHQVVSLAFGPKGTALASASWDGTVRLWDVAKAKERTILSGERNFWSVAYSPNGKLVAAAIGPSVKLWDTDTEQERPPLDTGGIVRCLEFAPDGKTLVVAIGWDTNNNVQFWDVATWKLRANPDAHLRGAGCLAFSPDSKLLATGSHDRTVKLWSVATAAELATLEGHSKLVEGVAFSPDGKLLASCDAIWDQPARPGEVKVWDVATRKELLSLVHSAGVFCLAFSPDGKTLATGCGDYVIRLYDVIRPE